MPKVTVNDLNIYYEIHGDKGNFLILIGGLTRDHTIWRNVVDILAATYRVIIFDNRGAGQTDKPDSPYSIELLSDDLFGLMNVLGIEKANIIGHSMGAFMAMHLAANHPEKVKNLALCSACTRQVDKGIEYLTRRIGVVETAIASSVSTVSTASEEDIRHAMPWLYSKKFMSDPEKIEAVVRYEVANPNPQPGYAFKQQAIACIEHDARHLLTKIKSPTLVISGIEDGIITPEVSVALAASIPDAELVIMDDTAHMLQIENPEAFVRITTSFFEKKTLEASLPEAKAVFLNKTISDASDAATGKGSSAETATHERA